MQKWKPKFTLLLPVDMVVSPGVEEWKEMIDTADGPSSKSTQVTLESLDVLTTPT